MSGRHSLCIFAPALFVGVTIERADDGSDDIHLHPGGQGYWIARMARELGERPILCAPIGGEVGRVARALIMEAGIDLCPIEASDGSPAYVHDRRNGDRRTIAEEAPHVLDRHERDDIYATVLDKALATHLCVVTGRVDRFAPDVYRRLGADFAANGVRVVGDLHGEELDAFLEGGPIDVLKVSDEDLAADGTIDDDATEAAIMEAIARFEGMGASAVVVSRGRHPAIARDGGRTFIARPPVLETVDHRGSGDSMTAGLATALARGLGFEDALRLACAAGASTVTRHGLGSGSVDLIAQLTERVELELVGP